MSSSSSSSAAVERLPLPERTPSREKLKTSNGGESIGGGNHYHSVSPARGGRVNPNSAYVPQNRLSRYLTAISSLALVKFNRPAGDIFTEAFPRPAGSWGVTVTYRPKLLGSELPLDKIGLFSSATFRWLNEYLYAGFKNGMKDKTLPTLSQRESCNVNGPRLEGLLRAHFVKKGQAGASIPQVAWEFVRTRVLIGSFIHLLGTLISLAGPIFILRVLINVTEECNELKNITSVLHSLNATENNTKIIIDIRENENRIFEDEMSIFSYTGLLAVMEIVSQFLIAWASSLNLRTACRLRSACLAVSYKKLLRSSLRCSTGAQQTLTYFAPDSEVLHELISLGPLLLSGPTVLVIVSVYAWINLGMWAGAGIFVVVFLYSCLVVAAYFTKSFAARAIEYSLRRMSLVEEFISNIQLAKVALWDRHFQDRIKSVRRRELAQMQFGGFSEGCGLSMVHMIPVFAITSIMLVSLNYESPKKRIHFIEYVPVLVLFLVNLKQSIRTSWMALSSISKGLAFLNKLKSVLILQEADRFVDKPIDRNFAIIINNGHFTWSKGPLSSTKSSKRTSRFYIDGLNGNIVDFNFSTSLVTTLSEIDFYVPKGKLVGIYGREASGKTSFLLSILGQLRRVGGTVAIDGTCSYVPAEPWLMDGTVRENVLFGENFDSTRYYKAIRSSHLHADISSLVEFDDTDVSVAGFGPVQRQKIGLARAVYAQRDINLLDEPLNDLTYLERLQLFEKCVMQAFADRTVIVASERIEILSRCHVIYVMQEGKIVDSGSHDDLVQSNIDYAKLVKHHLRFNHHKGSRSGELSSTPSRLTPSSPKDFISSTASFDSIDHNDDSHPLYSRGLEFPVLHSFSEARPKTGPGVYLKYTGGWGVCFLLCFLAALYAGSIAVAPWCIVSLKWSEENMEEGYHMKEMKDNQWATGALATLVGFLAVCGVILTVAYNKTIFVAAIRLHDYWIDSLGSAKISIFSSVTISLLLNICSLNLQEVDMVLPRSFITVMINVGISFFSIIILWTLSPWLVLPVFAFVVIAIILSIYIRGAVLSLHELKVSSATLVLNYIGNTVQGRATIQAFSKEKEFAKKYYKLFNENSTYDFMLYATRLWIEFRLKLLSVLVLSAVILTSEMLYYEKGTGIYQLGLAYLCSFQLCLGVLHAVGALNNVYTSLMALNSVDHYMKTLPKEREGIARLSSVWPMDGSIEFRNVLLYDREESSKKPLTFCVTSGEKIAVISSQADSRVAFVSALFRFMELPSGEIFICGTSISQVPLETLRRCISFVPGNPRLFNGTIRHNLDPSEKMADQLLMMVLQKVYLWEKVSKLPEKLVSDSCHLFTIYEKILIFLARALLNDYTKIIIMEEPEFNGVEDRSEILEMVLRDVFADYTVIRLSSHKIRSCHKLLYLDDEMEDYNSDRGSSTLSQFTTTTELYTAVPANVLVDGYNSTENL